MSNQVIKSTAPSGWASYLINGDASGLEPDDKPRIEAWLKWVDAGFPVDCEDDGFRWSHDASQFGALAGDCQEYTFLKA